MSNEYIYVSEHTTVNVLPRLFKKPAQLMFKIDPSFKQYVAYYDPMD